MTEPCARIFLLSHMRACTSLAGHILGSHPAINGYFEMHLGYEEAAALDRQLTLFRQYETLKADSRYLFDKLLHNNYRLEPGRLGPVDIRILVSLLEPVQTIRSIVDLFASKGTGERYADPVQAAGYYIERLEWLAGFCASVAHPYYYYDAELLLEDTARLLGRLTAWLDLATPLSGRYRVFSQTGKPRKGDTSKRIRSGAIVKTRTDYSHVQVPAELLDRARAVYRECRATMIAHAADALLRQ
jgi:hypothetical protein